MLLQNYLQNRKSSSRGDLPDPMGIGQYCLPCWALGGPFAQALALSSALLPPWLPFK